MAAGAPHSSIQGLLAFERPQATSTANLSPKKEDVLSYLRIIRELAPVFSGEETYKEIFNVSKQNFDKMQTEKGMKSLR